MPAGYTQQIKATNCNCWIVVFFLFYLCVSSFLLFYACHALFIQLFHRPFCTIRFYINSDLTSRDQSESTLSLSVSLVQQRILHSISYWAHRVQTGNNTLFKRKREKVARKWEKNMVLRQSIPSNRCTDITFHWHRDGKPTAKK